MANPLREFIRSQAEGDTPVRSIQEVGLSVQESITGVFNTATGGDSGPGATLPNYRDPNGLIYPFNPGGSTPTAPEGGFSVTQKAILALGGIALFSALVGQLFTFEVGS